VSFGLRVCERFSFDQALVKPSRMADVKLASPRPAKSGLDVTKTALSLDARPWTVARALDELYRERQEHPS
jgi:dTDP-4-dehydrorhamnose reductase